MPTQSSIADLQQIAALRGQLLAIRQDAGRRRDQMRSLEEIIREEREQAWKHSRRTRGGYIPTKEQIIQEEREEALRKGKGRRGKGKACGGGWIRPDFECRRDWGGLQQRLERLERLDARVRQAPGQLALALQGAGDGEPCGASWISRDKTCRKGSNTAPAAADNSPKVGLANDGSVLINGQPPKKALGGGAFGDTFMADGPGGPVVVKVDRLTNGDPMEGNPGVDRKTQRRNMVERERANMQKAHELGMGPEPLGEVQQLADGRLAFAYRMQPGSKLAEDHRAIRATAESEAVLAQPGALARYAMGIKRLARTMADSGFEHGDLHGGNILVGPDGSPSLIDWGMARQTKLSNEPHNIARNEAAALFVLGGTLVNVNSQVDRQQGPRRIKPAIGDYLDAVNTKSWQAERAYKAVIEAFDDAYRERTGDAKVSDPLKRITEANRLVRSGMSFDEAERKVGLLPPLPKKVIKEAQAARDRIFGPDHLRRFRRAVDKHYAAWEAAA